MKKLAAILALTLAALPAMAYGPSNIKLSLWDATAVAVPNNNLDEISGLDLGIGSDTEILTGLQLDLLYANVQREMTGVQWAWIFAQNTETTGLQVALLAKSDLAMGLQTGFVTFNTREFTGAQWGAVNFGRDFTGLQLGFVNFAERANGLQLGFVNFTQRINGVQIGLINFAKNGFVPVMVLINGNF